jgi:hypothetical protein
MSTHQLVGANVISRDIFSCRFCFCRSLRCRRCKGRMAKGGLWDDELCSVCEQESPLHFLRAPCAGAGGGASVAPGVLPVAALLEKAWVLAHDGFGPAGPARVLSVRELEAEYRRLCPRGSPHAIALRELLPAQVRRAVGGGFVTGLGGLVTAAVALPANVMALTVLQIRLVCVIARLAGWDTQVGFGRIVALCYRPSVSYHIR